MSSNNDQQLRHVTAVNLARRWTVQNEHDLMQEDIFDNTLDSTRKVDRSYCEELANHLMHSKDLPVECREKYADVYNALKRRDTDMTHPTSFLS